MSRISIGRRIAALARHLRLLRNRCLNEAGCAVGGAHFHVFMYFAGHDGCSEKQAASAVGKDKTYVAKAVKKLIAQGMITSCRDAADARCKCIHLTEQGKIEAGKAESALGSINDIISRGISEDGIDAFLQVVDMMQKNVIDQLELE